MEAGQTELIVAMISLVPVLFTMISNTIIQSKKRKLQFYFYTIDDWSSTIIVIRNIGPQVIFIDELFLHKTYRFEVNITRRFKKGVLGPLPIAPGKTLRATITEEDLVAILNDCIEKCNVNNSWPKYKEYRLAFKIVAYTSDGKGSTTWFKIGHWNGKGKCRQYDYSGYNKSYYELRSYYNSINWGLSIIFPLFFLIIGAVGFHEDKSYYWLLSLLIGYVSLVSITTLYATDGLPNRNAVNRVSMGLSVCFLFLIWMVMEKAGASIFLSIMVLLYTRGIIGRYSGWNM